MTRPEQALAKARAAAAEMRGSGAYAEDLSEVGLEPSPRDSIESLLEWAAIEPDMRDVRSTHRLGAPVTMIKRVMLRLLWQYNAQLIADQTRFNVHVLGQLGRLEHRIKQLERRLAEYDEHQ